MQSTIIGRLAVACAAVAATITAAAGVAHADTFWFYAGDYDGAPGTPHDVLCQMTIQKAECYPNWPTYPIPGDRPQGCLSGGAASVYSSGPAILHYTCRDYPGTTNVPKWQPGDHQRVGRFVCAASDENGSSIYCSRDDGGGNSFDVARTWYRLSDNA
ncbi:hypothetical protein AB0M22_04410 [Nocardia sp. NPDC051756]|uniref:hypothetical protein n=1 Tax=Nocardia sp. NPDC051756 TaxID=3154751 RepID=UPI00341FB097